MKLLIDYYRWTGKYYTSGEYIAKSDTWWGAVDELKDKLINRERPGLIAGSACDYVICVRSESSMYGSRLIFPWSY